MARIRTIKPELWQDEKLAPLPPIDRLVFIGLICQADDAGRLVDNVRLIDGLLFPETADSCGPSLQVLTELRRIRRYTSDSGQRLIQIEGWERHQKVKNPSAYVLPGPAVPESGGESTESLRRTGGENGASVDNRRGGNESGHGGDSTENRGRTGGDSTESLPITIPDPLSPIPDLGSPIYDPQEKNSGSNEPGCAVSVDNSGREDEPSDWDDDWGRLMGAARDVAGLATVSEEEQSRNASVLRRWKKAGFDPAGAWRAIWGTRDLVDAGKVSWISRGGPFGLRALQAKAIADPEEGPRPLWELGQRAVLLGSAVFDVLVEFGIDVDPPKPQSRPTEQESKERQLRAIEAARRASA